MHLDLPTDKIKYGSFQEKKMSYGFQIYDQLQNIRGDILLNFDYVKSEFKNMTIEISLTQNMNDQG